MFYVIPSLSQSSNHYKDKILTRTELKNCRKLNGFHSAVLCTNVHIFLMKMT